MLAQLLALRTQQRLLEQEKTRVEQEREQLSQDKEAVTGEFDALKAVYVMLQAEQKTLEEHLCQDREMQSSPPLQQPSTFHDSQPPL